MTARIKTLLVFDWFGEDDLAFYLIDNPPEWLARCHNIFGNGGDDEIQSLIWRVSDAICATPKYYGDANDPLAGKWADKRIDLSNKAALSIGDVRIVVTGWIP